MGEIRPCGEQQDLSSQRTVHRWVQQKVSGIGHDVTRLAKVHTLMSTVREESSAKVYDFSYSHSIFFFFFFVS